MSIVRCAVAAMAALIVLPAAAATTTYDFTKTAKSATGSTTTQAGVTTFGSSNVGQYGDNGTDYGNTITWNNTTNTTSPMTVSAWGTTAPGGLFEKAYIGNYSGDLGITSQPVACTTSPDTCELNTSHAPDTGDNQHAIDNVGSYEALMFSFQSAVTLTNLGVGFPPASSGLDTDATILYYTGSGDPSLSTGTSSLSARTVSDLTSHGWAVATNTQLTTGGGNALNLGTASSQYWLVGANMSIGAAPAGGFDSKPDYFKVDSVTTTPGVVGPRSVPEPGTLVLFGIASIGLLVGRRRGAARH